MACDLYSYKNNIYTADNLYQALRDPASHEEIFWDINKDILEAAKEKMKNIKAFFGEIYRENPKEALYEIAVQGNSSESEKKTMAQAVGMDLTNLAQSIFPYAQVGSTYSQEISRTIKKRFPEPANDDNVNFQLRIVNALANPKVTSLYNRFYKSNPDKFYFELLVYAGKQQVDLLKQWNQENNPRSLEEMITGILANMSQVVTVKTAMSRGGDQEMQMYEEEEGIVENVIPDRPTETQYYQSLTVPGGTNYTENEIATPGITPAIKGHAAFATDKGIGWFRSDDKIKFDTTEPIIYDSDEGGWGQAGNISYTGEASKTRRILEVQSDLFQKGRDKADLATRNILSEENLYGLVGSTDTEEYLKGYEMSLRYYSPEENYTEADIQRLLKEKRVELESIFKPKSSKENDFLQLLNKDNGWVTFFVKTIIQDSAKKGYEKVWFPSGDTAAKVEGHDTLEEYIAFRQKRLKSLREYTPKVVASDPHHETGEIGYSLTMEGGGRVGYYEDRREAEHYLEGAEADRDREIEQFELEIEQARTGTLKISAVANFYEKDISNILKKKGFNPVTVTDEYGNTWNEISIDQTRDLAPIQMDVQNFEDRVISVLRNKDIIGSKKFRGEHWVKKTSSMLSRDQYQPQETERRNIEKIGELNKQLGYDAIRVQRKGDGYIVKINIQPPLIESIETLPDEETDYKDNLVTQLYTSEDTPVTTTLLKNVANLASNRGRQDLVEVARFVYKYLSKNPTLTVRVAENAEEWGELTKDSNGMPRENLARSLAGYDPAPNRIMFNLPALSGYSLEKNLETVLHEMIHAISVQPSLGIDTSMAAVEFNEKTFQLFESYLREAPQEMQDSYRFKNVREFITGMVTDKAFRDKLITSRNEKNRPFLKKIWDGFIKALKKLLGIPIVDIDTNPQKDEVLDILAEYLDKVTKIPSIRNALTEQNRDYNIQFETVPDSRIESEKEKIQNNIDEDYQDEFKSRVRKLIDTLNSLSSTKSALGVDENFYFLFREARRLGENTVDELDYFLKFINEFRSISRVAKEDMRAIREDQKMAREEKIRKFHIINTTMGQYDIIIKELKQIKEKILVGTPLEQAIADIIYNVDTVHNLFNDNILPLVSSKIVDLAAPAVQAAVAKEKAKVDEWTKLQKGAQARGDEKTVKMLQGKIDDLNKFIEEKLNVTEQFATESLTGIKGDSNMLGAWMEPMIVNKNVSAAAVAKHTSDAYHAIAPKVNALGNAFQTAIEKYAKATGLSINDIDKFSEPLIETVKAFKGFDKDGKEVYEDTLALLNPYNLDYIQELRRFTAKRIDLEYKIRHSQKDTEKEQFLKDLDQVNKDRRQFLKDYMEQPYKEEVHATMDLLDEDLGGFTARQYTGELYDKRDALEKMLDIAQTDAQLDDVIDQITAVEREIKRLRYDENKDPNSKEYKIAQQLKKYDEGMRKYRKYVISPSKLLKFKREKERVDQLFREGKMTEKARGYWYQQNTVTERTESYWEAKKAIIKELEDYRERMGIKDQNNEGLQKLYQRLEALTRAYRDNEGVINGRIVPEEEVNIVRDIELQMDQIREEILDITGLSKEDKRRMAEIAREREDIETDMLYQGADILALQTRLLVLDDEWGDIVMKKNGLKKKDVEAYYKIIQKLRSLDNTTETHYYQDALEEEKNKLMAQVKVDNLPKWFEIDEYTYRLQGELWIRTPFDGNPEIINDITAVQDAYRKSVAAEQIFNTDWYKNNHIQRLKYIDGDYVEVDDPLAIWKHTSPVLQEYIRRDEPAFKYKTGVILQEFRNERYAQSIDGHNVPKLVGAKDDRFVNKRYLRLANSTDAKDKAVFEALKFLTEQYHNAQDTISSTKNKPGYELPSIRKTSVERITGTKASDAVSDAAAKIKGFFKSVEEDLAKNEQDKDILFGQPDSISSIPIKFIGDIDIKDQSRDVFRTILMFSAEMAKRKALTDALPFALAVRGIVKAEENKPVKVDSKGKVATYLKKVAGNKYIAKLIPGESQTSRQITEYIRTYYFGESIKDEPLAKPINNILGLGAKALLGMNYAASVVNYMNAFSQSLMESEVKTGAYSYKNMFRAIGLYTLHTKDYVSDMAKYGNKSYYTQLFEYFGGSNFNIITKQNKTLAYAALTEGAGKILIPNEMAEHAISNQLFLAMALEQKVKRGNTMVPLLEAFEIKNNQIVPKDGVEFSTQQRLSFIGRMNAAARRINGNYNQLDKTQAQKYILGRSLLFMNNYFVPFLVRRFGNKRFSIEDGVQDQGYWRTTFQSIFKDIAKHNSVLVGGWKYLSQEEKVAAIRTMTEISYSGLAIIAIMLLGGGEPEDLQDNGLLANNLIYILKMFRRQNEQFMIVPGLGLDDIYQKIKSPFPIVGKIGNVFSLVDRLMYHIGFDIFGRDDLEKYVIYTRRSGWHEKGELKIWTDLSRLFGITYRFSQLAHPDVTIKNMDAYRIK